MALKKKTATAQKKGKGRKISIDMTGVEAGGVLVPEGDYAVKAAEVEKETSDNSGNDYLAWALEITKGKYKGKKLFTNTSLQPKALWNLKGMLEAAGVDVPDSVMELDLDELVGIEFAVTVEHETYENKKRAKVVDVQSLETLEIEDGDGDDAGETEGLDPEAVKEMDEEELDAAIEEYGLDVDLSKLKTLAKKRQAVIDAIEAATGEEEEVEETEEEETGEEEEAGEEEEEISEEAIREMDADDLKAFVEKHELDVNLAKFKKLSLKQDAVIEALEAAGGEEETEEEPEEETPDIDSMGKSELADFVKENKLKVTLAGTTAQQRRLVKKAAVKAGLVEAE